MFIYQRGDSLDPITHGIIGIAISAFSGSAPSIDNPATLGCMVGAMMPDTDFVIRLFKDELHYLKHHRGFSHSVPMLALMSGGVALALTYLMGFQSLFTVFVWTFIGALSHTIFDMFNSYGAMLFTKKKKLNLLSLYDPVVSVAALFLILKRDHSPVELALTAAIVALYLAGRYVNRRCCEKRVVEHYSGHLQVETVRLMPSLKMFHKWDFVMSTKTHSVVGTVGMTGKGIKVVRSYRNAHEKINEFFETTSVGKYFSDFTPNYHLIPTFNRADKTVEIKAIDLRYHFRNEFMHHATVVVDDENNVLESYFRPYSYHKKISVTEAA
jgi:inner membrane protein